LDAKVLELLEALKEFKYCLVGIVFTVLGVTLTYDSWREYHVRTLLRDHGKVANATPTAWDAVANQKTGELGSFTLNLQYVTDRGDPVTVEKVPVPADVGLEVRSGRTTSIKVKYLPETPSAVRHVLDISTHAIELSMGLLILAGGLVITVVMFFRRPKAK
jgi:hypothetical protein